MPSVHEEIRTSELLSGPEHLSSGVPLDQRMAILDGEDVVLALIHEFVANSLIYAEASYVERRLPAYAARSVVSHLFTVIAVCEPTLSNDGTAVFGPVELPRRSPLEEPPTCSIDPTCRLEIHTKKPSPRPMAPYAQRQSKKRLLLTTSLAASSMLTNSAALLTLSPRARAATTRSAAATSSASNPIPGVPYSTSGPIESPRKAVALLKTAMRLAAASPHRRSSTVSPPVDDSSVEESSDRLTDSDCGSMEQVPARRYLKGATLSPTATTLSSSAWSITLPGDPSLRQEVDHTISTSVDVEFVLPERLPVAGRRRSSVMSLSPGAETRRASRDVHAYTAASPRRGAFLQLTEEHDAVEIDPVGMLGSEMREQLALSPGVKLQRDGGELIKAGPLLPDVPSKMRRSTFAVRVLSCCVILFSPFIWLGFIMCRTSRWRSQRWQLRRSRSRYRPRGLRGDRPRQRGFQRTGGVVATPAPPSQAATAVAVVESSH
jgi:hypothetical protein